MNKQNKVSKISLVMLSLLLSGMTMVFAQPSVDIQEDTMSMSNGEQNGYTMTIANVEPKFVEGILKKQFKQYKGKQKGNYKEEIFVDNAVISEISDNTVDLYFRLTQLGTSTSVQSWMDLGGIFLNSKTHPDATTFYKDILQNFSWKVTKTAIEQEMAEAENTLDGLHKELDMLAKDKSKLQSGIEKNKNNIVELNADVANNTSAQDSKRAEIIQQKDVIADLSGDLRTEAEKTLKSLKRDQKKLESEGEKLHKSIENAESDIKEAERDIERNEKDQKDKQKEIDKQKQVIAEINGHLDIYRSIK